MTLKVLICDDSALARRQMASALPPHWDIEVSFAGNGLEALAAVHAGKSELMFLDLNMPVMNGYQVLDEIRSQDLPAMVLVVSGDIQSEARQRVMAKGALDFLRKPVSAEQISEILGRYGILALADYKTHLAAHHDTALPSPGFQESLREVVNVAMGQAGSHLSELLDSFIQLPVPDVFICNYHELPARLAFGETPAMTAGDPVSRPAFSGVSHGFRGTGVAGEGIVILRDEHITKLGSLLKSTLPAHAHNHSSYVAGLLSDLSELLVGSCLKGVSQQLDLDFNHSYPALLGSGKTLDQLLNSTAHDNSLLVVSIIYHLADIDIDCLLLLLFTESSLTALQTRVEMLSADERTAPR